MRPTTAATPNVPPRDPERPTDDPYDANVVRFLLSTPGADGWTRGTLTEHLRGQARLDPRRVAAVRDVTECSAPTGAGTLVAAGG